MTSLRYCLNNLPTWVIVAILCTTTTLRFVARTHSPAPPQETINAQPAVR